MRSNLTILEQNTLLAFEHEDSQALYLRGSQNNELMAFKMAREWEEYLRPFMHMVKGFGLYPDKAVDEITEFMKERQFRRYFPGN